MNAEQRTRLRVDLFLPFGVGLSPRQLLALCHAAEVTGFEGVACGELAACEAMALLGAVATTTSRSRPETGVGSDGHSVRGAEVAILDEFGRELRPGDAGEICSRGPGVMLGYSQDPERTKEAFEYGWLQSSDLGRVDADGYIRVCGRKQDILIRGGTNVSPSEIGELLLERPAVADVAVTGMPDPKLGGRACAFVVPASGAELTLAELTSFRRSKKVATQKLSERLELRARLPGTATDKVEKYKLREELASATGVDLG